MSTCSPFSVYEFSFLKEGTVTVTVVSKYDNSIEYGAYTFKSIEKMRSGDINGDNKITSADARLILRISANISKCSNVTMLHADADGNGKVSAGDARAVLRVAAHLDDASKLFRFVVQEYNNYWYENIQEVSLYTGESKSLNYFILRGSKVTYTSSNRKLYSFHYNLHACRLPGVICLEHIYARCHIGRNMKGPIAHKTLVIYVAAIEGIHAHLHHPLRSTGKANMHTFASLHAVLLDGDGKLGSLVDSLNGSVVILIEVLVLDG